MYKNSSWASQIATICAERAHEHVLIVVYFFFYIACNNIPVFW